MSKRQTKNPPLSQGAFARPKAKPSQSAGAASLKLPAGSDSGWKILGVCVFLVAAVWFVFGQTLHFGFINYDDPAYVYENGEIARGLSCQGIAWIFTHSVAFNWHPLTMMSHLLDCQFYGLNAGGHHLTSVLLHTASAILLFLVLREMTGAIWRSAFVAVVFAVHPLHVESVAWVAERKDVLSGLFFMLTLWAYLRYVRQSSWPRYLLVLLAFVLGLMSKPMLVTLPFVLLLLDYWPLRRFELSTLNSQPSTIFRLFREKIPMLALSAVFCVIALFTQEGARVIPPLSQRLANSLASYFIYLEQMFWPARLAVHYPYPEHGLPPGEIIMAALVLAAISVAAWTARRKHPCLLVGWLWYLGMLVPVIGWVQVGGQAHADRYTYLPQIGLYLMLVWLIADLSVRLRQRLLIPPALAMIILAALIGRAHNQIHYWKDSETLWLHTLACTANNDVAHNNLGQVFQRRGQLDEAIPHFQKAVAIAPNNAEACNNLGYALYQTGQTNEGIAYLQQALAIRPDFAEAHNNLGVILLQKSQVNEAIIHFQKALASQPDNAEARNNLGNAFFQNKQLGEAIAQYQVAIAIQPDYAEAHCNLSYALLQRRDVDAALGQAREALKIRPDYAKAHKNLGIALVQKGQLDEGILHLQQALAIQPGFVEAQVDLAQIAWIMATSPDASVRNGTKAVALAQQADQLSGGKNPVMAATLAAAYAEAGRFSEAIATAQRALQLAGNQNNSALVAALERQLKLYQAGSPFHETDASR